MSFDNNNFDQTGRSTGTESRYDENQGFRTANPAEGMYGSQTQQTSGNFNQSRAADLKYSQGGSETQRGAPGLSAGPGGEFATSTIGGRSGNFEPAGQGHQFDRAAQLAFDPNQNQTSARTTGGQGAGQKAFDDITGGPYKTGSGPGSGQFDDDFDAPSGTNRSDFQSANRGSSGDFAPSENRDRERDFERNRNQDKPLDHQISNLKRDIENAGGNQDYKKGPRDERF